MLRTRGNLRSGRYIGTSSGTCTNPGQPRIRFVMPRELLDQELYTLLGDLLAVGDMVDEAISKAWLALESQDKWLAQEVVEGDAAINEARWRLEGECYLLLATQQPMATDLRTVTAVLQIVSDIERIGDHAKGIARIILCMTDPPAPDTARLILQMFEKCRQDLLLVLQAFVKRDEEMARSIVAADDRIDALYRQSFSDLLLAMEEDRRNVNRATYLLWMAHKLERIHDRITNMGRRTILLVSGPMASECYAGQYSYPLHRS